MVEYEMDLRKKSYEYEQSYGTSTYYWYDKNKIDQDLSIDSDKIKSRMDHKNSEFVRDEQKGHTTYFDTVFKNQNPT